MVEVVDDIKFCMDAVVVLTSVLYCFVNNKLWITSDTEGLLDQKKDGGTQELRQTQKELRVMKGPSRRKTERRMHY